MSKESVVKGFSLGKYFVKIPSEQHQQRFLSFTLSPKSINDPIILLKMSSGEEEEEESRSNEEEIAELEKKLEIAKLEQKLRSLKGEEADTETETVVDEVQQQQPAVVSQDDDNNNFKPMADLNAPVSDDDTSFSDTEDTMYAMLSESWKEDDPEQSGEGNEVLGIVAKVAVGILALTAFSQIPVGQDDYTKYSAVRGNPRKIDLGDLNDLQESTKGL